MADRATRRMPIDAVGDTEADILPVTPIAPKYRKCLRCGDGFESQWAGERICLKCKRSSTWRSDQPTAPPPRKARR